VCICGSYRSRCVFPFLISPSAPFPPFAHLLLSILLLQQQVRYKPTKAGYITALPREVVFFGRVMTSVRRNCEGTTAALSAPSVLLESLIAFVSCWCGPRSSYNMFFVVTPLSPPLPISLRPLLSNAKSLLDVIPSFLDCFFVVQQTCSSTSLRSMPSRLLLARRCFKCSGLPRRCAL